MKRHFFVLGGVLICACTLAGCYLDEYNTQSFGAGEAACLSGKRLFFDGGSNSQKITAAPHFDRYVTEQTTLPVDPTEHETIVFSEADPFVWRMPAEIAPSDSPYSTLFIGSDGTIAFGSPGTGNRTLLEYYSSFQFSVLPVDVNVDGGAVRYAVDSEEVVITYENVGGNTFQCELGIRAGRLGFVVFSYQLVSENTHAGVVGIPSASPPRDDLEGFLRASFMESNLCEDSPLNPPARE